MKLIDTNYLVRLITNDVPDQAELVAQEIACSNKDEIIIEESVLSELCFILQYHRYTMTHKQIGQAVTDILQMPQFKCTEEMSGVVSKYMSIPELDYVDCLLLWRSKDKKVMTFDKKLQKAIDDRR